MAIIPLAESVFGYLTDESMLEMANLEHPLLKKLMSRAPGTFHHSVNLSVLAESAARAIGCNALLAKVGALYHDVGKTENPGYFVENQGSVNPHDSLTAIESARIITMHVTDGAVLAKQHKLSARLVDFIKEHHGTTLIRYFYEKEKENNPAPRFEDFEYPGPKPRSRETAILMISDQVEAMSRALPEKSEPAITDMVARTIERIQRAGQFDESPLTMQELARIQETLVRTLVGQHHHRIEYPRGGEEALRTPAIIGT